MIGCVVRAAKWASGALAAPADGGGWADAARVVAADKAAAAVRDAEAVKRRGWSVTGPR